MAIEFEEKFSGRELAQAVSKPFQGLRIEFYGKWKSFNQIMNYFTAQKSRAAKMDLVKGQREFLNIFKKNLLQAFVSEGSSVGAPFAAHSPKYKNETGIIGQRSKAYLYALQGLSIEQRNYSLHLSFKKGALHRRSFPEKAGAWTLARYSIIFESGSSKQPARPFWNPTFNHIGGKGLAKTLMENAIKDSLKRLR